MEKIWLSLLQTGTLFRYLKIQGTKIQSRRISGSTELLSGPPQRIN